MTSTTSGGGQLPPPDPSATSKPSKSFIDAINTSHSSSPSMPVKPLSIHHGEPAVFFSKDEIEVMAKPFNLSLIGKFSFARPPMEVIRKFVVSLGLKGNSQVSLLDQRHVLINLSLEEDYTRLWLRQFWYINGRSMRMFKWTTSFRCSEESPIVPVWISLPFLPVHFVRCKQALHSIAAAVGKPFRVDQATAIGNRPSVARVLIEYDISQALLPRIWIGEGDEGFWQEIIFERVPLYCHSCKHLGHAHESCYISNPELRVSRKKNYHAQGSGKPVSGNPAVDTARPTIIENAQPMHTLENDHRNPGQIHVTLVQSDTVPRDVSAKGLQETQKNDALASIVGVEGHAAHAGLHGDLHATATPDQQTDSSPYAINDPGPSHTPEDIGSIENSKNASGHMANNHHAPSNLTMVGHVNMVARQHVSEHTSSSPTLASYSGCFTDQMGPMATVHAGAASVRENITCFKLVTRQQEGAKAAPNEEIISVNQDGITHLAIAMTDVGVSTPGPSVSLNQEAATPIIMGQHAHGPHSASHQLHVEARAAQPIVEPITSHYCGLDLGRVIVLVNEETRPINKHEGELDTRPISEPNSHLNLVHQEDVSLARVDEQVLDSNLGHKSNLHLNLDKSLVPVQSVMVSKEVSGPPRQSSRGSSSVTNSFSFQAGHHISYNPNPTVVEVDSLPMPEPTYASEDYITEGTIDDSDSYFMPDYSHVEFNTHSHIIPDEAYYGPVSRSHSLDAQESRDDDFILARCGTSDSAIGKSILRDEDGTIKVTPRKTRQYHLRPRNRRR